MKVNLCLLIIFFFFCPLLVLADTISIDCIDEMPANSDFYCNIDGTSDSNIKSIGFDINVSEGIIFNGFYSSFFWNDIDNNTKNIVLNTDMIVNGNFSIGTIALNFKFGDKNKISLNNVYYLDEFNNKINLDSVNIDIKEGYIDWTTKTDSLPIDNNSYINDIIINDYELNFDPQKKDYYLNVFDNKDLIITPVITEYSTGYDIRNNNNIKNGSIIYLDIFKSNGEKITYNIHINNKNKDNIYKYFLVGLIIFIILFNIVYYFYKYHIKKKLGV